MSTSHSSAPDILTALQTTYDQLLTQFFSTISYLSQRHPLLPPEPVPGDPYTQPPTATDSDSNILRPGREDTDPAQTAHPLHPVSSAEFAEKQKMLAEDLVRKAKQISALIERLPGSEKTAGGQEDEVRKLVAELREVEEERKAARKEMKGVLRRLEAVVGGMAVNVPMDNGT